LALLLLVIAAAVTVSGGLLLLLITSLLLVTLRRTTLESSLLSVSYMFSCVRLVRADMATYLASSSREFSKGAIAAEGVQSLHLRERLQLREQHPHQAQP
jgi:hypothetical protein